jgi:hypothetical protein
MIGTADRLRREPFGDCRKCGDKKRRRQPQLATGVREELTAP